MLRTADIIDDRCCAHHDGTGRSRLLYSLIGAQPAASTGCPQRVGFIAEARSFSLASTMWAKVNVWLPTIAVKGGPRPSDPSRFASARTGSMPRKSAKCISPCSGLAPAIILRAGAWTAHSTAIAAGRSLSGVRIAERGKFDLFFIADSLVSAANDHPSMQTRLEPTTTVAALSLVARSIGFGCTVSTSFSEPFNVARVFQSLAHLTKGRIAWNIVTSNSPDAHLNFSREATSSTTSVTRSRASSSTWCAGCGAVGTKAPSCATGRRASSSIGPRCMRSTTRAGILRCADR